MSLKDSYFEGSTGLHQLSVTAFNAGIALVGATPGDGQYTLIQTGLQSNAALGNRTFTITVPVTYNPVALRNNNGNNVILKSYFAGIQQALASSAVYNFECALTLNVADTVTTAVNFNFTF